MVFSRKTLKRGNKKRQSKKRQSKKRLNKKTQRGGYTTTVTTQSNQSNQSTNINDYIYAITNSAKRGFFAASI